jgi:hypothetical protein
MNEYFTIGVIAALLCISVGAIPVRTQIEVEHKGFAMKFLLGFSVFSFILSILLEIIT